MIETITVSISDYLALACVAMLGLLFTLLFFFLAFKMRTLADRYRLKYGFDRDIEAKEFGNDSEKMDRREKMFKRRVFKD